MSSLADLSLGSRVTLHILMGLIGLLMLILAYAQINLLRGRPFQNPDGTADDWHEQKLFYGIAWADLVVAIPLSAAGLALTIPLPEIGLFILGAIAVWMVWVNLVTTITSLRFEEPRLTLQWFLVFPFGILVGLAFLVWLGLHFEAVYR